MFGKHILDLAPTPENRRNSEGCFLTITGKPSALPPFSTAETGSVPTM